MNNKIVDENYMICEDCFQFIINDDLTALDYHYDADEAAERETEICTNYGKLMQQYQYVAAGDIDKSVEFSTKPCDCCRTKLHGARHHTVVWSLV